MADGLWTFLEMKGNEPTNKAAEHALSQSVVQRKISHDVQSANKAICHSGLLTVTTTLATELGWLGFLEQARICHYHDGVMPSLRTDQSDPQHKPLLIGITR